MGWPLILEVRKIETLLAGPPAAEPSLAGPFRLKVASSLDDAILAREVEPPVVLAVGDAPGTFLRVPTLKARFAAKGKAMKVLEFDPASLPSPLVSPPELFRELSTRESRKIEGDPPKIARELLAALKGAGFGGGDPR